MADRIMLQRQADGSFVDWGRHATVQGVRGAGPARWYRGEAAEVMALVLKHSERRPMADQDPKPLPDQPTFGMVRAYRRGEGDWQPW